MRMDSGFNLSSYLHIKKLRNDAKLPSYAHPDDVGMDLYAPVAFVLRAHTRTTIDLGFASEFDENYMIEIRDKGGLAAKHGITVLGGIFDAGYRGPWLITLLNTSDDDYHFQQHEKLAQAILVPIEYAQIEEVTELSEHARGTGHHGSSGRF